MISSPKVGVSVLHLFLHVTPLADTAAIKKAFASFEGGDQAQSVTVALLGHKADIAVMGLSPNMWDLRKLQTDLQNAGLEVSDSYVSITEISEYADGLPEKMKQDRLYPVLPPEGKASWCFYPMSKRRGEKDNWFTASFEKRKEMMHQHGASGKQFRGRIIQLITGSTGLDDFEWGVTLFGVHPDDLKDAVYTMRYDEASALYGEFGAFYTGIVASLDEVLTQTGVT